ncbi:MAG: hypothetical protein ACRDBO_10260 [Lachnospiraceae bacterium]
MATWFLLTCKRYLKKGSFLVILLLLPAAAWLLHTMEQKEAHDVRIAVYVADAANNELGNEMLTTLTAGSEDSAAGMFAFYSCSDEQQLKDDVAARRAECGYVISQELKEKLDSKSFKRSISVYSAPSTVLSKLTTEIVFAALAENYNRHLLKEYVAYSELFDDIDPAGTKERAELAGQAETLYDKWLSGDATFRFETSYQGQEGIGEEAGAGTAAVFPVRGLVAVYLFVIGIYSAVINRSDWDKGVFLPLTYSYRYFCSLICLAAPVVLAGISALTALVCGGSMAYLRLELAAMIVYLAAICLFSWLLGRLLPGTQLLSALIPFFVIGSLAFCPVFLDLGALIPALKPVGRLFLPYYYLQMFR